jgi:hypothetical protein
LRFKALFFAVTVSLLVAPAATAAKGGSPRLVASVGPAAAIAVTTVSGRRVNRVKAGTYIIVVHDRTAKCNFHLVGPAGGVNRATTVRFVGERIWTVRLIRGSYSYVCDLRPERVRGSFVVV